MIVQYPSLRLLDQENLCLIRIQFQLVHPHSAPKSLQTTIQNFDCLLGIRRKGENELGVIRILMAPYPKPPDDLSQWLHVDVEQHGGQNGALWHPTLRGHQHHLLGSVSQEAAEPLQNSAPKPQLSQQTQKDTMVNDVKRC